MIYTVLIVFLYTAYGIPARLPHISDAIRRRWFITLACAGLCAVCALRSANVGTDMASYLQKFTALREYPWRHLLTHWYSERVEIGFALLCKAVGTVTAEPHAVMIVSAVIIFGGVGYVLYRESDDPLTCVIVLTCCGWYLYTFNITRQMIAGVFLLIAWSMLTRRRILLCAVWFCAAVLFHVTAAVFILAFWIYAIRRHRTAITVTLGVGGLLAVLHPVLLGIAAAFTDSFSYLNNSREPIRAGGIWAVWTVECVIIAFYLWQYYFRRNSIPETESLCSPVFCGLYILFAILGTSFNNLDRFGVYFLPFCATLFDNFGCQLRNRSVRLYRFYRLGLHACFVAFFLLFATRLPHYRYEFFWE